MSGGRFQSCLREIRKRAQDVEDEKKGIRIKKEDWGKLHVHIASYNNFPTAAGLASSAAGLACFGKVSSDINDISLLILSQIFSNLIMPPKIRQWFNHLIGDFFIFKKI